MACLSLGIFMFSALVISAQGRVMKRCNDMYEQCQSNNNCCSNICDSAYKRCVPQRKGYTPNVVIDDHAYLIWHKAKLTWPKAKEFCEDRNMELLSLDSKSKFKTLSAYLHNEGFTRGGKKLTVYWTSGNSINTPGEFVWHSTEKPIYKGLWEKPPTDVNQRQCVDYSFKKPGTVRNTHCSHKHYFICERDIHINDLLPSPISLSKESDEMFYAEELFAQNDPATNITDAEPQSLQNPQSLVEPANATNADEKSEKPAETNIPPNNLEYRIASEEFVNPPADPEINGEPKMLPATVTLADVKVQPDPVTSPELKDQPVAALNPDATNPISEKPEAANPGTAPNADTAANPDAKAPTNEEPIGQAPQTDLGNQSAEEQDLQNENESEDQSRSPKKCTKKSCRKNKKKGPSIKDNKQIQISQVGNVSITNSNVNSQTGGSKISNIGNTQTHNMQHIHNFNYNKLDTANYNLHNDTGGLQHINIPTFDMTKNFIDNSNHQFIHGACGGLPCPAPMPFH